MFKVITLLFVATLLSGCATMAFDGANDNAFDYRSNPTANSRLQFALEHQPAVAPNECIVLGADSIWRKCE
jgi:hypothetical protein